MSEKLTHDEHYARAMLMGLEYDWFDGTYCTTSGSTSGLVLACDTLEPLTRQQIHVRYVEAGQLESYGKPTKETPWARM